MDVVFTLFPVICDENMHIVIYLTSLFPAHFLDISLKWSIFLTSATVIIAFFFIPWFDFFQNSN